ncbi:hypothetical protein JTE90_012590 [Oedothorax gibbosus]|uniref:Uncharacterized protein n=1 Tax=Oedothorax gibbosus TaxID=931172 RepID=A0AAV6V189_9ARAC|nr:hypothetical protein JTE90_012590 [Oedothorax gibbosus]
MCPRLFNPADIISRGLGPEVCLPELWWKDQLCGQEDTPDLPPRANKMKVPNTCGVKIGGKGDQLHRVFHVSDQ